MKRVMKFTQGPVSHLSPLHHAEQPDCATLKCEPVPYQFVFDINELKEIWDRGYIEGQDEARGDLPIETWETYVHQTGLDR